MTLPPLASRTFLILLTLLTVAFLWIVSPMSGAILWGVALAILFRPLERWVERRTGWGPTAASLATTTLVLLLVILPAMLLAGFIVQEVAALLRRLQSGEIDVAAQYRQAMAALPAWLVDILRSAGLGNLPAALDKAKASAASGAGQPIATQLWTLSQTTLDVVLDFFVMLYLLFFLLRDGDRVVAAMRRCVPLDRGVQDRLLHTFSGAVGSTVKGNLVVAAVQGALGAAAFMVLGVPAAVVWGAVMALVSLLPAVGAALVWLPVSLVLLARGEIWQGVSLIVFGVLVIGLVDNVLRPILVGKETRMPDYVVLITTIGAMSLIGINGFVVGPVVAALFMTAWKELRSHPENRGDASPP